MQMPDRKFQNANSALLQGIIEIIFFSFNIKIETNRVLLFRICILDIHIVGHIFRIATKSKCTLILTFNFESWNIMIIRPYVSKCCK